MEKSKKQHDVKYVESHSDTCDVFKPYVELDPEEQYFIEKIYEGMKKLTLWTIDEGIKSLICPKYVHMTVDDSDDIGEYIHWYRFEFFDLLGMRWLPIARAVQSDTLKVIGFDEKNKELNAVDHVTWHNNFGGCKVSPFEFLEFVKKHNLFSIPTELECVKKVSGSGEVQYSWASDVDEEAFNKNEKNTRFAAPEKEETDTPAIISSALMKNWEPENELTTRASEEIELAIWNKWIKPIVDFHYNGVVEYIYFSEPQALSYDDFEKVWELSVAPFIRSCMPPGIKIPVSTTQAEIEELINNNIWEPNFFISEVLLPLKAGRGLQFVDSFLPCLISIIDGKDLPAFLAYISQAQDKDSMTDTEEKQANTIYKESDYGKILADICPEVDKFYKDVKDEIMLAGNYENIKEIEDSTELFEIVLDYFERKKTNYSKLELTHFNDETVFYTHVQRPRRRIIGIILQNYLKTMGIKKPPSIDYLFTIHNTIIRD